MNGPVTEVTQATEAERSGRLGMAKEVANQLFKFQVSIEVVSEGIALYTYLFECLSEGLSSSSAELATSRRPTTETSE